MIKLEYVPVPAISWKRLTPDATLQRVKNGTSNLYRRKEVYLWEKMSALTQRGCVRFKGLLLVLFYFLIVIQPGSEKISFIRIPGEG